MPHQKPPDHYLSVTEILSLTIDKPFLRYWYGKNGTELCEKIKRESQDIGVEVHSQIEQMFNSRGLSPASENSRRMVHNFWDKFVIPFEVKPITLEVTLKDEKLRLQGTYDAVISTSKGVYLADWKTSNTLDKVSIPLQLSMYSHLQSFTDYGAVNDGVIVRLDKEKDTVQVYWYENLKQYEKIWKAALLLARFIKFGEVK